MHQIPALKPKLKYRADFGLFAVAYGSLEVRGRAGVPAKSCGKSRPSHIVIPRSDTHYKTGDKRRYGCVFSMVPQTGPQT